MKMGNQFYTENADSKVLAEIIKSGKEGIYQKEILARIPGIHRSTINRVATRLEKKRLIRIIPKGKTTKYIAINNAQINIEIGSYIFGNEFVTDFSLLGREGMILCDKLRITYPDYINFARYRQLFEPKFTEESRLEKTIFEFANQIGAFIIYVFIQAMNEDNINKLLLLENKKSKKVSKNIIERENQNRFVTEEWIKNSISLNLIQMLWRFKHVLEPFGLIPNILTKEGSEKRKKLGPYLLDKKAIVTLSKAFANLYPRLYYELENIRTMLPGSTISYKEYEKSMVEKSKEQRKCKHEFSEPRIFATSEDGKREAIVEICSKCNYRKHYRKEW
jgi:hypothetical protein